MAKVEALNPACASPVERAGSGSRIRKAGVKAGGTVFVSVMWVVGCPGDDVVAAAVGSVPTNVGQNFGLKANELIARLKMENDANRRIGEYNEPSPGGSIG